jgi:thiosulfate/3-mercaptopyruvate sulfurtransferase
MELAHPEHLVTTDWLAEHLDDPSVVVLDVTGKLTSRLDNDPGRELWVERHIPGSQFFDVASAKGVLSDPGAELPWTWPSPERFAAMIAAHGISADSRVVVTARTPRPGIDSGTMWCTRAWWTMHHFGVDCAILLGGIEQWDAEGRPMVSGPAPSGGPPTTAVAIDPTWDRGRASKQDVLALIERGEAGTCLVDALPAESFAGRESTYGRPGHIVGAVNVPFRGLIDRETCGFVDAATMADRLQELLDARQVITYCGGAIAATVPAFCLALLGHEHVSVYDGSLMEWAADPALPMVAPDANRHRVAFSPMGASGTRHGP